MNSPNLPQCIEYDESRTPPFVLGLCATCILGCCGFVLLNRTIRLPNRYQTQLFQGVPKEIETTDEIDEHSDLSEVSKSATEGLKEESTQRSAMVPAIPRVEKGKGVLTGNMESELNVRRTCGRDCQCCKSEPKTRMGCINDYLGYAAVWYVLSRLVRRKM
jgi:hypothetical protein